MSIYFTIDVSLEDSMIFESVYHENLQFDLDGKKELKSEGIRFLYLAELETGKLIGETYFIPLDEMKNWNTSEEQPEEGLNRFYGKNCMYAFSTTILPEFQSKGYGKILKSYFLGMCNELGFDFVLGHARDGASLALQLSFGAKIVDKFPNWYKTGETYYLYQQEIMKKI